jgi:threonylcarbamoyladenosine tRNA methylthiotransferase MtaB
VKYSVLTFGCRVNQADSLAFEEAFAAAGGAAAPAEAADVVVVNTCSVTATADQGARQAIRRIARRNPGVRIVVTGCYATRRPAEVAALPNVERVVANDDKPRIIELLRHPSGEALPFTTTAERFGGGTGSCGAVVEPGASGRTAFTLRVQTGCAQACSYCIIPTTRGRPRSAPVEKVAGEVRRIAAAGFKEIVLTGVHLGSYGRDLGPPSSLAELLDVLHRLPLPPAQNPLLFRVSSLEPMDCTPEIVDRVASSERFAAHFHLPLQHASERLLAAMKRPYTIGGYAALVERIRARIPHAAIGSDVIVGFPGESDADFTELESYLAGSPLTHLHVFPYSDRPGTLASTLPGKVHGSAVRERAQRIRKLSERLDARFYESQMGSVHRALTLQDGSLAVTGNFLKLRISEGRSRNEWVRVRVGSNHQGELLAG